MSNLASPLKTNTFKACACPDRGELFYQTDISYIFSFTRRKIVEVSRLLKKESMNWLRSALNLRFFPSLKARKRTSKLFSLVDDLGHTVMENMVAGEPSLVMKTRNFNLTVKKDLFQDLGNTSVTDKYTKFNLPSLEDMGLGLDKNGSRQYTSVELQVGHGRWRNRGNTRYSLKHSILR